MRDYIRMTAAVGGLSLATIAVGLLSPGVLGALTPIPLSFDSAVGVFLLGSFFLLVCVGILLFGRLVAPRDAEPDR